MCTILDLACVAPVRYYYCTVQLLLFDVVAVVPFGKISMEGSGSVLYWRVWSFLPKFRPCTFERNRPLPVMFDSCTDFDMPCFTRKAPDSWWVLRSLERSALRWWRETLASLQYVLRPCELAGRSVHSGSVLLPCRRFRSSTSHTSPTTSIRCTLPSTKARVSVGHCLRIGVDTRL